MTPPPEGPVLSPGQEPRVRAMVHPTLPPGWVFLRAVITRDAVRAWYAHLRDNLRAELRVAFGTPLRAQVLVSRPGPATEALSSTLRASVRNAEGALVGYTPTPSQEAVAAPPASAGPRALDAPTPAALSSWLGPLAALVAQALREAPAAQDVAAEEALARALRGPPWSTQRHALREALERAPGSLRARLTGGLLALAEGDLALGLEAVASPSTEAAPQLALEALHVALLLRGGCLCEARAALEGALGRFPAVAALHEASAALHTALHAPQEAVEASRRARALDPGAPAATLRFARALLVLERFDEAQGLLGELRADGPEVPLELLRDLGGALLEAGAFTRGEALYRAAHARVPEDPEALAALGALGAWRGDGGAARAHGEALLALAPEDPRGYVLLGAALALEGAHDLALGRFDQALARAPGDATAAVWRAEALLRLGRPEEALAAARRGGEGAEDLTRHVSAQALVALAQARLGAFPGWPDEAFERALETLHGAPPALPGRAPTERLEDALRKLRGNRSARATYVNAAGELTALTLGPTVRVAAKAALWRFVATGDLAPALAALDALAEAFPSAPEPFTYRGELYLDHGDSAAARDSFARALERYDRARWAYIGLGAVEVLEGRPAQALETLRRGVELAGAEGPTAVVWRGEALRLLGRHAEAQDALALAVARHPSRVGAWVNLALNHLSRGDLSAARRALARLEVRARSFVREGREGYGGGAVEGGARGELPAGVLRALLEGLLAMLRGNRSGSCVTYFSLGGRVRTVPPWHGPNPSRRALRAALRALRVP